MHPIEGVIIIAAGTAAWLIGTGRYPADAQKRKDLEVRLPWVRNRKLMYGMAVLLWAFGFFVLFGIAN